MMTLIVMKRQHLWAIIVVGCFSIFAKVAVTAAAETFNFTTIVQEELETIFTKVNETDTLSEECNAAIQNITQNNELVAAQEVFLSDYLQSCGNTADSTCTYEDNRLLTQGVRVQMDACNAKMGEQLDNLQTKCQESGHMYCQMSGIVDATASESFLHAKLTIDPLNCVGVCLPLNGSGCLNITNTTTASFDIDFLAPFMEAKLGEALGINFQLNGATFDATFKCFDPNEEPVTIQEKNNNNRRFLRIRN